MQSPFRAFWLCLDHDAGNKVAKPFGVTPRHLAAKVKDLWEAIVDAMDSKEMTENAGTFTIFVYISLEVVTVNTIVAFNKFFHNA